MLGYTTVDVTENDTGDALFSEVLGLPMIMRGEPSTPLMTPKNVKFAGAFGGKALCELIGLPLVSSSANYVHKPMNHNVTFGFLPQLLK